MSDDQLDQPTAAQPDGPDEAPEDPAYAAMRDRVAASDPASDLAPLDASRAATLLTDVMSTEATEESRETGTRGRSRLTWLVAAAAVVVIAAVGALLVRGAGSTPSTPEAGSSPEQSVTRVSLPARPGSGRCMAPNADTLATATVAVAGTVVDVRDGVATVRPTHWYAGPATDVVQVVLPARSARFEGAVDIPAGGRVLVAAGAELVYGCGMSGPYSADLARLYADAFGG